MEKHSYSLGYRADIEGLRAIAVLLVVLSHANIPGLHGGFMGVDIFFVLSGYLITGLLISEVDRSGKVSFLAFYARRLKRLGPALFTMLSVSLIAAYFLISPVDQRQHFTAAGSAALWLSNIYFALEGADYFEASTGENLFLHTWSLGVEEQFYLVWPALMLLLWKITEGTSLRRRALLLAIAMLIVGGVSFAFCVFLSANDPTKAFYLPVTRAWQFAAGAVALLFTHTISGETRTISAGTHFSGKFNLELVSVAGMALLLLGVFAHDKNSVYPSTWAVLPTLGTTLLLAGTSARNRVNGLLSIRPMQFIGKLSYGWYLWHWPFLILTKILAPSSGLSGALVAIFLALGAAWLSYTFVESPIRHAPKLAAKPRWVLAISGASMTALVIIPFSVLQRHQGTILSSTDMVAFHRARSDVPQITHDGCDDWYHSAVLAPCDYGAENPEFDIWLVGDSVLGQWFAITEKIREQAGVRVRAYTKSACPMVDEPLYYKRIGRRYDECEAWRDGIMREIRKERPDLLILGSSSAYSFTADQWEAGTIRILDQVSQSVNQIVILQPTPILQKNIPACVSNRVWQKSVLPLDLPVDCTEYYSPESVENQFSPIQRASNQFENVNTIGFNDLICPDNICAGFQGETIVFRDRAHVTDTFVHSIATEVSSRLGEISPRFR